MAIFKAFLPNGSSRCFPHSCQCDEINCSLAKQFEDAESYAQCPIYYDHWRTGVQSAQWPTSDEVYRIVLLNDELPNVPPNRYGTLARRKREKVYLGSGRIVADRTCADEPPSAGGD